MPFQVFDLHNNAAGRVGLNTTSITSNTNTDGAIIDTAFFQSLEYYVQSGTLTDGTYTVQLFHGNDSGLSDAAQVTGELILGSAVFAATDDNAVKRVGYIGKKRYVRIRIVSTGVTAGGTLSAVAVLGTPSHAPVA